MKRLRFIRYTAVCAVLLAFLVSSVSAEEKISVKPDADAGTVTVTGNFKENPDTAFAVYVLYPGKDVYDLMSVQPGELMDYINQAEQIYTDSQGLFSLTYRMNGDSGVYKIYAASADGSTRADNSFFWIGSVDEYITQIEAARAEYGEAQTAGDDDIMKKSAAKIKNVLENVDVRNAFGIYDEEIPEEISIKDADEHIFELMASREEAYTCAEDVRNEFMNSVIVYVFNDAAESEIGRLLEEYGTRLESFNTKLYTKYKELQKEDAAGYSSVNSALAKAEYMQTSDISELLVAETVLTYVKNMNHYSEFMPFIEETDNAAGLDLKLYEKIKSPHLPENVLKAVVLNKKNYKDLSDLLKYFTEQTNKELNRVIESSNTSNNKTSGGGSGGGGIIEFGSQSDKTADISKEPSERFIDLPKENWAYSAVSALADKGIVSGDGTGMFRPNDNIKREEILKTILLAFGIRGDEAPVSFTDVKPEDWFYPYVAAAKRLGYINGYDDGRFGTGDFITRQDMAVLIYNIASGNGAEFSTVGKVHFNDIDTVSDYAKNAVYALAEHGILLGTESGNFNPYGFCTRAEMAAVIYRVTELLN